MDSHYNNLMFEKGVNTQWREVGCLTDGSEKVDEWRYGSFSTLNKNLPQMMKGLSERCETPNLLENNWGKKALRHRHSGGSGDFLEQ